MEHTIFENKNISNSILEVLKMPIDFVEVNRTVNDVEGNEILEFTLWLKTKTTTIEAYRLSLKYETALEVLKHLIQTKVPSNYRLVELKDKAVLTRLYSEEDLAVKTVLNKYQEITHIKFELTENSFHNTMLYLVDKDASLIINGKNHPLNNLVFNRDNLNISCRIYDKEYGFSTKPILELLANNIQVFTQQPIGDCPNLLMTHAVEDGYESTVGMEDSELEPYNIYINEQPASNEYLLAILSREYYIKTFSYVFDLQVMKNVLDALASKIFEVEKSTSPQSSNKNYYQGVNRIAKIAPMYTVPTIEDLSKNLESLSNDAILKWLYYIKRAYGTNVCNLARQVLETLDFSAKSNLALQINLQQKKFRREFAHAGIMSHALKTTCTQNRIFMHIYCRRKDLLASSIFSSNLYIETFPKKLL